VLALKGERPATADDAVIGPQDSEQTASRSSSSPPVTAQAKRKAQRAAGITVLVMLMQNFPKVFAPFSAWKRLPLKIGIHDDIIAAMPGVAVSDIGTAMRIYTTTHAYLRSLIEGAERIDLAGQPAGIVTADTAEFARASLAGLLERRSPPAATSSPAPKAKRVTLADLRTAAERRRKSSEGRAP
jgi:sRNA-binding protein